MIKYSILIPVYNGELYLKETLDSILNQSYTNYECIIVDDGSTDNSKEVYMQYISDKRFKVFKKKNGGIVSSRNYALSKSSGDWIVFVDQDDFLNQNALKVMENYCLDDVDILMHGCAHFENGEIRRNRINVIQEGIFGKEQIIQQMLWTIFIPQFQRDAIIDHIGCVWTNCFRRCFLKSIKLNLKIY